MMGGDHPSDDAGRAGSRRLPAGQLGADRCQGRVAAPVKIKLPGGLSDAARASGNHRLLATTASTAAADAEPPPAGSAERIQQQLDKLLAWQQRRQPPASHRHQQQPPASKQQQRAFREALHFDPADSGSFPGKRHLHDALWQDLAASQDAGAEVAAAGPGEAAAAADSISEQARVNPFGWVPEELQDGSSCGGGGDVSISSVRPKTAQIRSRAATSLTLELFDSPEMEGVDIDARLQDAAAEEGSGLPALSRFFTPDGSFSWQPCTVLSYDESAQEACIRWSATGGTKRVKRLNLILQCEDRAAFRFRLLQAQRRRDESEREARFRHYVASLPLHTRSKLDDERFRRRVARTVGAQLVERQPDAAAAFLAAAAEHFGAAVNAAIVSQEFCMQEGAIHLAAAGIQPVAVHVEAPDQGCVSLQQLPPGCVVTRHTQPGPAQLQHRRSDADAAAGEADVWPGPQPVCEPLHLQPLSAGVQQLQQAALLAQPRVLAALSMYQAVFAGLARLQLVDVAMAELSRPMQLGAFVALQRLHIENSVERLMAEWVMKACNISEALLRPEGGADGSSDQQGDDEAADACCDLDSDGAPQQHRRLPVLPGPQVHPLHALRGVQVMALLMQQHLRTLVEAGLQAYVSMWQVYALEPGSLRAYAGYPTSLLPADVAAAVPDVGSSGAGFVQPAARAAICSWGADLSRPSPLPMFQLQLLVRDGQLQFVPGLQDLQDAVLGVVDAIVAAGGFVEDVGAKARDPCSDAMLTAMEADDPQVLHARSAVAAILSDNLAGPLALQAAFAAVQEQLDADGSSQSLAAAEGRSLEETAAEIQRLQAVADAVEAMADDVVGFRLVRVSVRQAKAALAARALAARSGLQAALAERWHTSNMQLMAGFEGAVEVLNQEPESTEDMAALEQYLVRVQQELPGLLEQLAASAATLAVLTDSQGALQDGAVDTFWALQRWPLALEQELAAAAERVAGYRDAYRQQLAEDLQQLTTELQQLQAVVLELAQLGDLQAGEQRLAAVQDAEAKLQELQQQAVLLAAREDIFGLPHTEQPLLAEVPRTLEPVAALWQLAEACTRLLPDWMDGPFTDINPDELAAQVDSWWRSSSKLLKQLSGPGLEAAEAVHAQLQAFQAHVPLIVALRNPGLRERHWERISAAVGAPIKADAGFSLSRALQLGLPAQLAAIEEVAESASKEAGLEVLLDRMQAEWAGPAGCFETTTWRATGCSILRGIDDIQQLLDDQIVKTQGMRASPHIAPLEERVRAWEGRLAGAQDVLDAWLRCQQGWLYLEPIFGSDDIQQQMPNEGRKFKAVDSQFRRLMERLSKQREVMAVTADVELLKSLNEANALLEQVQRGLSDYLEAKRLAFPRFFFLSDGELLEILAETRDPARVQPFLRKIFEGIAALEFAADGSGVTAMLSEEGERVAFVRPFNPVAAGGSVERWLIECEAAMRETVASVIRSALEDHARRPRADWLGRWPGQAVLAVDCVLWTADTATAIRAGALPRHAARLTQELLAVVARVRGQLSALERRVLAALIVVDVHARDVAEELSRQGVVSEADYAFQSQLRYTWEADDEQQGQHRAGGSGRDAPANTSSSTGGGALAVRMVNARQAYGNEYLGVSSRLVITPLTDRCYRTLMGALHLNLGGAPEGPAGTGKTETVKDLAKAVAMQCVVFNCSDGLDFLAMAKFFKGLASSGAWACFDEFNRIDIEVLSVIAQQIFTMQQAKVAGARVFEFEGSRLSLRPTFSVFITMNPGCAGRSELPDNLKALFRSVAMMVPDYVLITQISLYSAGYTAAQTLARKLVATYRLCSEQLSSQTHYDYGMRAVISVLRAAAANKQRDPGADEGVLMLRSIRDVNEPKFLAPDVPLFNGILSDLFPGLAVPPVSYLEPLNAALEAAAAAAHLVATPAFLAKQRQLYEMVLVRHGLMLVGQPFGGKTSMYRCLAAALADLESQGLMGEHRVQLRVINPKAVTLGQLYGQFDPVSHEWKNGVLAKAFREAATDTAPDRQWLVFDGPVDAVWIENMNTVLDDNKKLCLASGEIIQMPASMSLIFEVQDLAVASPATVSRTGMVFTEPSQLGWRPLAQAWLGHKLPGSVAPEQRQRLHELFEWTLDPCIRFVRTHCRELVPTTDIGLAVSLMNLLWSQLDAWRAADASNSPVELPDPAACLDGLFVFSLVWSLGATCDRASAAAFDTFLRSLLAGSVTAGAERSEVDLGPGLSIAYPQQLLQTLLPEAGLLHDFSFDPASCSWRPWIDSSCPHVIPEAIPCTEIIVPTLDTVRASALLQLLISHRQHALLVGPTGTAKTLCIKSTLDQLASGAASGSSKGRSSRSSDGCSYHVIATAFSAQTSANQIQDAIDGKLDKRRRGVLGPPLGSTAVVCVDDLNMPAVEAHGAQPPLELLRQFADHGGWYDRADNTMRVIADTQLVAAMGPPGGGRNPVPPRLLRHFNVLAVNEFDGASYSRIYTAISDWWARRARLPAAAAAMLPGIVAASISVYNSVRSELLPTPAKSHYTFNLRDLSRVFLGMQQHTGGLVPTPGGGGTGGVPGVSGVMDERGVVRLWAHEAMRVFHDRLVDDADRARFCGLLAAAVDAHTPLPFASAFPAVVAAPAHAAEGDGAAGDGAEPPAGAAAVAALRDVVYADFLQPASAAGAEVVPCYREASSTAVLLERVEAALADYNEQMKSGLDLVVFRYAAEHLARISRIIKQPYGSALLVGVGGSGRSSLTRLAAFIAGHQLASIEISKSYGTSAWHKDLKHLLLAAGVSGTPTVFLLADGQIKDEGFLEDLCGVLDAGEVPGMFAKDEVVGILEGVTPRAKRAGRPLSPAGLWAFFADSVRANLHLVLSMSPVGNTFRERLRKFPSLVNCTTIDFFSLWPNDALKSVAHKFLPEMQQQQQPEAATAASPEAAAAGAAPDSHLPRPDTPKAAAASSGSSLRAAVEDAAILFHTSVRTLAEDSRRETGQHTYVTPTSYLELICTYKQLLGERQAAVQQLRTRYEVGLRKLLDAEAEVNVMQQELIALHPKLVETGKEVQETLLVVDAQTHEAAAKKEVVEGEEAAASLKAAAARAIKDECEGELAVALPLLESALQALNTLTKADITEVRSMKNPPAPVKVTLEAVCQLLSVKPKKVNDPANPTRKLDDYWGPSQALLGDSGFLATLQAYDKDNIPPVCIAGVRPYLDRPELRPESVQKASRAAYGLCCWVRAMEAYDRVAKVVAPKKAALAQAEAEYAGLMEGLAAKKAELAAIVAALDALNDKLASLQARKQQLEEEVASCQCKLERATKLIGGLAGEKIRWREVAAGLAGDYVNLTGDVLLCAGVIAYLGPYAAAYRERAIGLWTERCRSSGIPCSATFSLAAVLGDLLVMRGWLADGLPNDPLSLDNALIVSKARRWPLMVDPQGQANKWVRTMERSAKLEVARLGGAGPPADAVRQLEAAVQFGFPLLIEDVGEQLDPLLDPLLRKAVFKQGGVPCIRLGDSTLEYNPAFRLYLTTKLRRPHYLPEVAVKVTLLNFAITRGGLEDQLLSAVVAAERPELSEEKARLVLAGADNARQLKEIEDKIIAVLSHSEGNILDDETAITAISGSKALAVDIHAKQQVAARTERKIDEARGGYKPVAKAASALFFVTSALAGVEPVYQWGLSWFATLFGGSLAAAERARDLPRRIHNLVSHFQASLYAQVCRGLFDKDKLVFSFLMAAHLKGHAGQGPEDAMHFLLTGGLSSGAPPPNPSAWLPDKCWEELLRLGSHVAGFEGLAEAFAADQAGFKAVYDAADPVAAPLPAAWAGRLGPFQRLLLLRVLRPDKLTAGVHSFVRTALGPAFVETQPLDVEAAYADSSAASPLLFVLSPGADPMTALLRFAERLKVQVGNISLGQGQGPKAARLVEAARTSGAWVVLQNCHLAASWMPALERLVEGLAAGPGGAPPVDAPNAATTSTTTSTTSARAPTHPAFRLWLTSYPTPDLPVAVLHASVKMTSAPPRGVRQGLLATYGSEPVCDPAFFGGCVRPGEFKKLLFGLCTFHAFVQERLQFGPQGWNVPYQFTASDFAISARQLLMFLNEALPDTTPMQALLDLTGECNYGGRVTDAHDRRTLASLLSVFYTKAIFKEGYRLSAAPGCEAFRAPPEGPLEAYVAYIRSLPEAAPPEVFGLHANAAITRDMQETGQLLGSLLASQGSGTGGGAPHGGGGAAGSREALLLQVASDLAGKLRQPFDIEAAQYKYPVDYYESLNAVLVQELVRFNRLLATIRASLAGLRAALRGEALMSEELERVAAAMFDGKVPASWLAASYPSAKPLGPYMADLEARLAMMQAWLDHGPPAVFWLAGFFFPQAFLTGTLQNYARRHALPIDALGWEFGCLPPGAPPPVEPPADGGAYVSDMWIDGARWDADAGCLAESEPKVLFAPAPLMLLRPCVVQQQAGNDASAPPSGPSCSSSSRGVSYECPLYRTPKRRGVLATTGHSTNFVLDLRIPSGSEPPDHWVRRGVAFLLSLAD